MSSFYLPALVEQCPIQGGTNPHYEQGAAESRAWINGYNVFTDRAGFDALKGGKAKAATKPYLGLFTRSHMSYEVRMSVARDMTEMLTQCQIDRDPAKEPSLVEMAKTAINSLKEATKHSDKGYFIVR